MAPKPTEAARPKAGRSSKAAPPSPSRKRTAVGRASKPPVAVALPPQKYIDADDETYALAKQLVEEDSTTRSVIQAASTVNGLEEMQKKISIPTQKEYYASLQRANALYIAASRDRQLRLLIRRISADRQRATRRTTPLHYTVQYFVSYGDGSEEARNKSRSLISTAVKALNKLNDAGVLPDKIAEHLENHGGVAGAAGVRRAKGASVERDGQADQLQMTLRRNGRLSNFVLPLNKGITLRALIEQIESAIEKEWESAR